jgi:alpha-tubulin suppressor-like RCC1 family protein
VKCWGDNGNGQLGDGSTTNRPTPVAVAALPPGVVGIAAGEFHTCVLTSAGTVKCWGANTDGALGDGTTTNSPTPVDVTGLSGVVRIAAGGGHTCAIVSGGGVKCWGFNGVGQIGDGSTTDRLVPTDVTGLSSGVAEIACGNGHTCALTTAGAVKCWGGNNFGELGASGSGHVPLDVAGLTGVTAIAASVFYTCALAGGGVKCWGYNQFGQIGDGSTTDRPAPTDVAGLGSDVTAIATGYGAVCALTSVGGVKCYGDNDNGELGDGTTTTRGAPADVTGLTSGVTEIATHAGSHACALTSAGATGLSIKCWGWNNAGQVGDGTTTDRTTPVDVTGL